MKNMKEKMADYISMPPEVSKPPFIKIVATIKVEGKEIRTELIID